MNEIVTRRIPRSAFPLAKLTLLFVVPIAIVTLLPSSILAQRDSIEMVSGRLRGTILSSTPAGLVVETDDGKKEVPGWQIRRVKFDSEPNELTHARSGYADDRYNVTLQDLERLTETPNRPLIVAEIDYYRAMASAKTALAGGGITANQALALLREFIDKHPDSYMLDAAREAFADLTFAEGKFEQASKMYAQLAKGNWPEISFQSGVKQARALMLNKQYDQAITVLQSVESFDNAEDYALQGKSIAKCLRAESMAYAGKADEAQAIAMDIIKNTDAKNATLFAYAYNALGASHLQKGEFKDAARAYLHTDLLFTTDPDAHAQALFQLSQIWPKLGHNDRALEARQKIKDRYRNTFWVKSLDGN